MGVLKKSLSIRVLARKKRVKTVELLCTPDVALLVVQQNKWGDQETPGTLCGCPKRAMGQGLQQS